MGREGAPRPSAIIVVLAFLARNGSKIPRTRRRDFGDGANRYYYANNALSARIMATLRERARATPACVMSVITRGMLNLSVSRRREAQPISPRISRARAREREISRRREIDPLSSDAINRVAHALLCRVLRNKKTGGELYAC